MDEQREYAKWYEEHAEEISSNPWFGASLEEQVKLLLRDRAKLQKRVAELTELLNQATNGR